MKSKIQLDKTQGQFIKQKVNSIRKRQARIGGRKLIYLLQDDFKKQGIKIGRDKFFKFLAAEFLLVKPLRNSVRTTRRAKKI